MDGGASVYDVEDRESGHGDGNNAESEISQQQIGTTKCSRRLVQRTSSKEENGSRRAIQRFDTLIERPEDESRMQHSPAGNPPAQNHPVLRDDPDGTAKNQNLSKKEGFAPNFRRLRWV